MATRIHEVLRRARLEARIPQKEVAHALGLSRGHYNSVEAGRKRLLHEHFAPLPDPIRRAVVEAAIMEHIERINRLRALIE